MRRVLQFAQPDEVIRALFLGFHVAVKHRGIRMQSNFMRLPRDAQPHLSADFVIANNPAHARMKNLRAAAGKGIDPRLFQLQQGFFGGKFRDAREVAHLDHGECFQVHARAALFEPADHFQKIFERQVRVQAADNVKFQRAFAHTLFRARINLIQRKIVGAGRVGIAAKGAKLAVCNADVCRIDVPIDVVIRDIAVLFLAHVIRQPAHGQQVGRTIQRDAVVKAQPFAGQDFIRNRLQP